ncbi:MAG: paraquat-inducible protein A [Myxococcota bacterium]
MHGVTMYSAQSAAARGLACCHVCFKLAPESEHTCPRCHSALHLRKPDSLQRTVALLITAAILYIPANVLPIMTTAQLGSVEDSTIIGGVVLLVHHGSYPVAAVIFVASVLVPMGKLFALCWLCWSVARGHATSHRQRTVLYRLTEFIGRWSMVDVFVVMILVALVHMGGLIRITPGPAAVAFAGVVIVTILAAKSFDPRLIWDELGGRDE